MSMAWNDILQLPEAALAGDVRVPKTQIVKQGNLNKTQEGLLGKLRDIRFFASLTKSNSYIQPVKDETYDIESVIFLSCGLNSTTGIAETLHVVHACFPNPTVILAEGYANPGLAISACIRRKSLSEHGSFVTEREGSSGLFDPEKSEYETFLKRIAYKEMPQTTLLDYVSAIADRCQAAYASRTLGFYPRCKDEDTERLMREVKMLRSVETRINELQSMRKSKDSTLADTTKLRVEIRKQEKERDSVMRRIKELCQ